MEEVSDREKFHASWRDKLYAQRREQDHFIRQLQKTLKQRTRLLNKLKG